MSNKSKVIGFDADKWGQDLTNYWVGQQTARLIAYAKDKIQQIGNKINSYPSRKHLDNTHNLLDSLCWGLSYNQNLISSGFYREQKATEASYLHEWWKGGSVRDRKTGSFESFDHYNLPAIYGHQLAEKFLSKFASSSRAKKSGWTLFFAILTPYWGYWEKGFTMKAKWGSRSLQFPVMAETRDEVKGELVGANISFSVYVENYTNTGLAKTARRGLGKNLTYK